MIFRSAKPFTEITFSFSLRTRRKNFDNNADDTTIPKDTIKRLLAVDQQIVCGVQPLLLPIKKKEAMVVNIMPFPTAEHTRPFWPDWLTWKPPTEPFPVFNIGFGCVLLHRDPLEKLGFPWFQEDYGDAWGANNITEDIFFCQKVSRAGYQIWCEPTVICGHYKTVDLRTIVPRSRTELDKGKD